MSFLFSTSLKRSHTSAWWSRSRAISWRTSRTVPTRSSRIVALERAVGGQRLVEFAQQPLVVDDEAELLLGSVVFLVEPIHSRDGLQKRVLAQRLADVQDRVPGRVESGQQLGNDDQDLGGLPALERFDDLPVVLALGPVALHRLRPEALHRVLGLPVDLFVPLPVVGRGDDDLAGHVPDFVQQFLESDRGGLGRRNELGLEARVLPVLAVVFGDVEGLGMDRLLGPGQRVHARELALEIGLLVLGEIPAVLVEPEVNRSGGDPLIDQTSFIEKRHDGTVLDGLIDRVLVDEPAECGERALFLAQQRGAGEAEVACLRQKAPHALPKLAVAAVKPLATVTARVRPVALVDQHEDVGVVVGLAGMAERRLELVDDGRDQWGPVPDQLQQVTSAPGADRLHLARLECVLDLAVQVAAVGDDDDPRVHDLVIKGERAAEHDHRQ